MLETFCAAKNNFEAVLGCSFVLLGHFNGFFVVGTILSVLCTISIFRKFVERLFSI